MTPHFPRSPTTRRVEFVLDLICVHSYLALTRFERAAARRRARGDRIEVVFRPFQIAPEAPAEGEPLTERHRRAFGAEAERMTQHMTAVGAREGLRLDFARAVFVNTLPAHRLLAAAGRQGRAEPMAERLFRAYLTDGANIGDAATLDRLAAETGVRRGGPEEPDEQTLTAELAKVRAEGVRQVPLLRFGTGTVLTGAQPEEVYFRALSETPSNDPFPFSGDQQSPEKTH
ncbi:DsbA family oxidoreductase [Streptomyces sp. NBC_00557]|uniref:DsbA family oxidoreductase n=1 Tax=Streptomyces sp. NBC_00557 TaxID=2975776 RepID=UPI002E8033F9|nr:DsbA family oxidoreductase [Streptomyces sp. NBC_00557]WUC32836.1 DsbA family oxidoreductase [Streptomyces sp. NBC_00557]